MRNNAAVVGILLIFCSCADSLKKHVPDNAMFKTCSASRHGVVITNDQLGYKDCIKYSSSHVNSDGDTIIPHVNGNAPCMTCEDENAMESNFSTISVDGCSEYYHYFEEEVPDRCKGIKTTQVKDPDTVANSGSDVYTMIFKDPHYLSHDTGHCVNMNEKFLAFSGSFFIYGTI